MDDVLFVGGGAPVANTVWQEDEGVVVVLGTTDEVTTSCGKANDVIAILVAKDVAILEVIAGADEALPLIT